MTSAYCDDLIRAIGYGIVEGLLYDLYPYRGCTVILIGVGWDDVMSSELAFYRPAKATMEEFRGRREDWELVG
ncbi:MAG TPA: hypothetical protein VKT80_07390 [Chloroflexota bacterium]|nr:hypothetical protein [Chloroflexota bacterium]